MSNGKNILLVDDDVDFVEQQKLVLEASGYQVTTAYGQAEAEEVAGQCKPDLAVVDLMMEHADGGFTLCHKLKRRYPDLPVVIVTAVAAEASIDFDASTDEEKSWIKADAILNKPVRHEQLTGTLERLLS